MKEYILSLIQVCVGQKNAISKQEIVRRTGLNERVVRNFIAELRDDGYLIISTSQSKGYYFPSSKSEAEHFVNEMEKRGRKCFAAVSFARQWIKQNEDQMTLL